MKDLDFAVGKYMNERYLVLDRFSGSMGLSYLVEDMTREPDPNLPCRMVAKTLHPHHNNQALYDQFLNEAEVWINIHPGANVVRAYFADSVRDNLFVFSEYVRRGILPNSLAEWIGYGIVPLEVALYFIVQLLDGMWYVYQDGIEFHGDLKPSNILIDSDFVVKINDWGLARLTDKPPYTEAERQIYSRYHAFSPYSAPEVSITQKRLNRGVDGFAIGVILGELISGRHFPVGVSTAEVEASLLSTQIHTEHSTLQELARIVSDLLTPLASQRVNYYEAHARNIADIFSLTTDLGVIDDSNAIIVTLKPPGHDNRMTESQRVIDRLREASDKKNKRE